MHAWMFSRCAIAGALGFQNCFHQIQKERGQPGLQTYQAPQELPRIVLLGLPKMPSSPSV